MKPALLASLALCGTVPVVAAASAAPGVTNAALADPAAARRCATSIMAADPKSRDDRPVIELYFEKPVHGRPGKAYACRSLMMTHDGDPDSLRTRRDFEAEWRERFAAAGSAAGCRDE